MQAELLESVGRYEIVGDLGAVVTGNVKGRTSGDEVTLFKSNGLAGGARRWRANWIDAVSSSVMHENSMSGVEPFPASPLPSNSSWILVWK